MTEESVVQQAVNEEFVLDGVDDLLRALANARQRATLAQKEWEQKREALTGIPEWHDYLVQCDAVEQARAAVANLDLQAREAIVNAYKVVQVKTILPGAGVQVAKDTMRIADMEAAVVWAKAKKMKGVIVTTVTVDPKVLRLFEGEEAKPEWIEVVPGKVSARIDSDLSRYLPKADSPDA